MDTMKQYTQEEKMALLDRALRRAAEATGDHALILDELENVSGGTLYYEDDGTRTLIDGKKLTPEAAEKYGEKAKALYQECKDWSLTALYLQIVGYKVEDEELGAHGIDHWVEKEKMRLDVC